MQRKVCEIEHNYTIGSLLDLFGLEINDPVEVLTEQKGVYDLCQHRYFSSAWGILARHIDRKVFNQEKCGERVWYSPTEKNQAYVLQRCCPGRCSNRIAVLYSMSQHSCISRGKTQMGPPQLCVSKSGAFECSALGGITLLLCWCPSRGAGVRRIPDARPNWRRSHLRHPSTHNPENYTKYHPSAAPAVRWHQATVSPPNA